MARKLVAEDPRFGGRRRPAFLITTELFLRRFGLTSLSELPRRQAASTHELAVDQCLSIGTLKGRRSAC
jgi:chromosome segregation and condensation protein ScpB